MELRDAKKTQFRPGATLQNGRTCLLYDNITEKSGVVLGYREGEVMPYATWAVHWTKNGDNWFGSTVIGNYFVDFEEAYKDYLSRRSQGYAFSGVV